MGELELGNFDISRDTGFIPEHAPPPLTGEHFQEWERVLSDLPHLIETKKLREEVDSLPELDDSILKTLDKEKNMRAYVLLCFLGQGYIWMEGQDGVVSKLPRKLAVPWVIVSEKIGIKPVGTYASSVLYNFGLHDISGHKDLENLKSLQSFTGNESESWFFMVHVRAELAAAPGLDAMVRIFQHMSDKDHGSMCKCFESMRDSIRNMEKEIERMREQCKPDYFFRIIRPFLAGFKDEAVFPNGICYEGSSDEPRKYTGASAAQSSSVYAFELFLGLQHSNSKDHDFVMSMRDYMPGQHRKFLTMLENMPSVKDFCTRSNDSDLVQWYNNVVEQLASFQSYHIKLVTSYIVNQVKPTAPTHLDKKGTGGTEDFMLFLKRVRDDTQKLAIKTEKGQI